jgi:hypothetical protein
MTALVALTATVSIAIFGMTGAPAIAALPAVVLVVGYLLWTLPLRYTALTYFGLALAFSTPPRELPGDPSDHWLPPFFIVYRLLFENLNTLTGVGPLRFSGGEAIVGVMIALALLREWRGVDIDEAEAVTKSRVLFVFLLVSLATVLALEVRGLARGGDFAQSLWQFRAILWLPIVTFLFSYCLRTPRDLVAVAVTATVAACFKIALGVYYLMAVARPANFVPESVSGHDDSVLFTAVVCTWIAWWLQRPGIGRLARIIVPCGWVLFGVAINSRRTAYVSISASLLVLYVMLEGPVKRWINRRVFLALPLVVAYLLAGRNHHNGIFKPASAIMSVSTSEDASSRTRKIENYNLIQTLRPNMLVGTGWGHEYRELSRANDISKFFPQYRFIAHNSVLWLLSIGGILGFSAIWMPVVIATFLAARSYRLVDDPFQRAASASTIVALVCYAFQAWSDMGTQSVPIMLIAAWALAASGTLASSTGAWTPATRTLGA